MLLAQFPRQVCSLKSNKDCGLKRSGTSTSVYIPETSLGKIVHPNFSKVRNVSSSHQVSSPSYLWTDIAVTHKVGSFSCKSNILVHENFCALTCLVKGLYMHEPWVSQEVGISGFPESCGQRAGQLSHANRILPKSSYWKGVNIYFYQKLLYDETRCECRLTRNYWALE